MSNEEDCAREAEVTADEPTVDIDQDRIYLEGEIEKFLEVESWNAEVLGQDVRDPSELESERAAKLDKVREEIRARSNVDDYLRRVDVDMELAGADVDHIFSELTELRTENNANANTDGKVDHEMLTDDAYKFMPTVEAGTKSKISAIREENELLQKLLHNSKSSFDPTAFSKLASKE